MRYTALIVEVIRRHLFGDPTGGAQGRIGVRLSPIDISTDEAIEISEEAAKSLPPSAYVAIAAPGARLVDGPRLFLSDGEATAARATQWRNDLQEGEALVYISARRLGRAGGLEDTLEALDEARLRAAALEIARDAARLPDEVFHALEGANILSRVSVRSVCRFLEAVDGGGVAAVGQALPELSLVRDSSLTGENAAQRLTENARWVRLSASGTGRQGIALTDRGAELRAAVRSAIDATEDERVRRLSELDLGALSLAELKADTQRAVKSVKSGPRLAAAGDSPNRPKTPAAPRPTSDAPRKSRRAKDEGGAAPAPSKPPTSIRPPRQVESKSLDAHPPEVAQPDEPKRVEVRAPLAKVDIQPQRQEHNNDELASAGVGNTHPTHIDRSADREPDRINIEAGARGELNDAGQPMPVEPVGGPPAVAAASRRSPQPDDGLGPLGEVPQPSAGGSPEGSRPPAPRRHRRRESGPWTAELHASVFGAPSDPPAGLVAMLRASFAGEGLGLLWRVSMNAASVFEQVPRGLLPATTTGDQCQDLAGFGAWVAARAALVELLGEDPVVPLLQTPFTVLGSRPAAAAARALVTATGALLREAERAGSDRVWAAMRLETVTVTSARGEEVVALSPLHPVLLPQLVAHLDSLATAARAEAPALQLLAQRCDVPPVVPHAWEGELVDALEWQTSPRWAPCYGAALTAHGAVSAATHLAARALIQLRPHTRACLRVIAAGDEQEVVDGLAAMLEEEPCGEVVVHTAKAVQTDGGAGAGTLRIEPRTPPDSAHLVVSRARPAPAAATAPQGMERWTPHPWRRAEAGAQRLSDVVTFDRATWIVAVGDCLTGPPPPGSFVLARGFIGREEVALLCNDLRAASSSLVSIYASTGHADPRPKELERRAREIAKARAGILTLGPRAVADISGALAEHAATRLITEEGALGKLTPATTPTLLGPRGVNAALAGDAFGDRVELVLSLSDATRPASAWAPEVLRCASRVFALADEPTLGPAVRALLSRIFVDGTDAGANIANAIARGRPLKVRLLAIGLVAEAPLTVTEGVTALVTSASAELEALING
jgi:hypothetical protein